MPLDGVEGCSLCKPNGMESIPGGMRLGLGWSAALSAVLKKGLKTPQVKRFQAEPERGLYEE